VHSHTGSPAVSPVVTDQSESCELMPFRWDAALHHAGAQGNHTGTWISQGYCISTAGISGTTSVQLVARQALRVPQMKRSGIKSRKTAPYIPPLPPDPPSLDDHRQELRAYCSSVEVRSTCVCVLHPSVSRDLRCVDSRTCTSHNPRDPRVDTRILALSIISAAPFRTVCALATQPTLAAVAFKVTSNEPIHL
jgi:hypothetical protein